MCLNTYMVHYIQLNTFALSNIIFSDALRNFPLLSLSVLLIFMTHSIQLTIINVPIYTNICIQFWSIINYIFFLFSNHKYYHCQWHTISFIIMINYRYIVKLILENFLKGHWSLVLNINNINNSIYITAN